MSRYLSLLIACLFIPASLEAATVRASSCSRTDVAAAIGRALNGDTVVIPAGACTWASPIVVGGPTSRTKMVKIVGAGTDALKGTRLTLNNTSIEPFGGACCPGFVFWLNHSLPRLEISNIRFIQGQSWTNSDEEGVWAILLAGHADTEASQIRIHHNRFEWKAGNIVNAIRIGGNNSYSPAFETNRPYIWGVIDHNTFHGTVAFQGIDIIPNASFGSGYANDGHDAWATVELSGHQGTWRNVFIEYNTILADRWGVNQAFMDAAAGGAFVFRNNTIKNNWITNHGYEEYRSGKWMEVYANVFILDSPSTGYAGASNIRGGTGVFYNNQFYDAVRKGTYVVAGAALWSDFFEMQYYRGTLEPRGTSPVGAHYCSDFSTPLGADNRDHKSGEDKGWLCADQPGARKGPAQSGWVYGYRWAREPIVAWNNHHVAAATLYDYDDSPYIEERRDYIDYNSCTGHMKEITCATFWDDVAKKKKNYVAYPFPHPLTVVQ